MIAAPSRVSPERISRASTIEWPFPRSVPSRMVRPPHAGHVEVAGSGQPIGEGAGGPHAAEDVLDLGARLPVARRREVVHVGARHVRTARLFEQPEGERHPDGVGIFQGGAVLQPHEVRGGPDVVVGSAEGGGQGVGHASIPTAEDDAGGAPTGELPRDARASDGREWDPIPDLFR